MSLNQNTEWLEAAKENYEQAVADGNIELATAVLADIRDNGFDVSELEKQLAQIIKSDEMEV